ncbi:MAG: TatD family hydrolase [Coraliomargaritaceae bacterium]
MIQPLYDAHVHLAAPSLLEKQEEIFATLSEIQVEKIVCNGTSPEDWPEVLNLAQSHSMVLPAIGLHPWKVQQTQADWKSHFIQCLHKGAAVVGEIGLDQWIEGYDSKRQLDAFRFQLNEAAQRNLPVSIHCLKAIGPLMDTLRNHPLPPRGFHLHAYNGPPELLRELVSLGAFFSFNAGQLKPNRTKILDNICSVPAERLLIETDAPDFLPSTEQRPHQLNNLKYNHPANLKAGYHAIATIRKTDLDELIAQVGANFRRYFLASNR